MPYAVASSFEVSAPLHLKLLPRAEGGIPAEREISTNKEWN